MDQLDTETHVADKLSDVALVPAVWLAVDGADLPPIPEVRTPDGNRAWHAQKRRALGLDPERPLGGLIALDEIKSDRLLNALVDDVVECGTEYGWAPYLDGGLVLVVDGRLFSHPTCCVDLEEGVTDWVRLANEWPETWTPVESGHPGVLARWSGDRVHVSPQLDDSTEFRVAVDVAREQIRSAIPPAQAEIVAFAQRLRRQLEIRDVPDAAVRARVVAGLERLPE